ncbi:MAG: hypothetical protein GY703_08745 [Gammaproteobacteria bacterium]|nr:hypothetical protein [Gammaproteobacteria bacterium]
MKKSTLFIVLGLLLVCFGELHAQQKPTYSPASFELFGTLGYVDFASRQVVIDGSTYPMAQEVQWLGLDPELTPEEQRDKIYNQKVGYKLYWSRGHPSSVIAIWVVH